MHEYAIAASVLRIVRAQVGTEDAAGPGVPTDAAVPDGPEGPGGPAGGATGRSRARVTRVHVTVGRLRQVVPGALAFSFELAARGTVAEGATLEIEDAEAVGRCRRCGGESRLEGFPFRCEACGGLDVDVVRGEELRVDWIEVEAPEMERHR